MWEDLVRARTGESNNGGPVGPSEKAPGEPSERPGAGASRTGCKLLLVDKINQKNLLIPIRKL